MVFVPPNILQQGNTSPVIQKGSLIAFHYLFWKNDPYPLVIVSNSSPGYMLKGVNLHYLTFPYVRRILGTGAGNPGFSYYNIKMDNYLVSAFRSYSWRGIDPRSVRVLDGRFLVQMMSIARSFDPMEIRSLREQIENQIRQGYPQFQPNLNQTPQTPEGT